MREEACFSPAAFLPGPICGILYQSIHTAQSGIPVRIQLLQQLFGTLLLVALGYAFALWFERPVRSVGAALTKSCVKVLMMFWFGGAIFNTAVWAQELCRQQFLTNAFLGALPILIWAGFQAGPDGCGRTASLLLRLAFVGGLLFFCGFLDQTDWNRLDSTGGFPNLLGNIVIPLYPEYAAIGCLCKRTSPARRAALPLAAFLTQAIFLFWQELIFGQGERQSYLGMELLRAWSLGAFSRMDALFILFWLIFAVYRIVFLIVGLRLLWQEAVPQGEILIQRRSQ